MNRPCERSGRLFTHTFQFFLLLMALGVATAQTAPMVIAWQAPADTVTMCDPDHTCFYNFVHNELPHISGIGGVIIWKNVDNCSATAPCADEPNYHWSDIDNLLTTYIGQSQWVNKKIVLIVFPENDTPGTAGNTATPQYVFTRDWAQDPSVNSNPQDVVVCAGWPGDITGSTQPVQFKTGATEFGPEDFAIWNVNGGASGCTFNPNHNLVCTSCSGGTCTDFSGFPVVYEKPIVVAYQKFLGALAKHYSSAGSGSGPTIAPYIAYVRVGMASGGENNPRCATGGTIPSDSRTASMTVQAGMLVRSSDDGNLYVATGGGAASSSSLMPMCSPPGCTTAPDNTVPGWFNAGPIDVGSNSNRVWPGPKGQFGAGSESASYSDNGYLSKWNIISDGNTDTGYITSMSAFLRSLSASFPFTISSHFGPPNNSNEAYAESEAIIASTNGVGFGMQSVNVGDSKSYAAGLGGGFPTTRENWAYNFRTYPAPVHHLQMNDPGTNWLAAGYEITSISVDASHEATITCPEDCSPLSGQQIYISGNSYLALNGIWAVNCDPIQCDSGTLKFLATGVSACTPCGTGGTVWAPDYWPIVMPFAVLHRTDSVEVWECSLDYAFGTRSTLWVDPGGDPGCATWGVGPGPDLGYQNALSDTLLGQPKATSVRAGKGWSTNGWRF